MLLAASTATNACGQRIPRSQHGMVMQRVGHTDVTVIYNRPVARGRELFGGVVRWGRTWDPGADSATTIEFSDDVLIDGNPLPAGKYSLWAIPRETGPWTFIFSKAHAIWHTPYPGDEHDELRLDLTPGTGEHMEVLAFYFPVVGPDSATMRLHWGETVIEFPIQTTPN